MLVCYLWGLKLVKKIHRQFFYKSVICYALPYIVGRPSCFTIKSYAVTNNHDTKNRKNSNI